MTTVLSLEDAKTHLNIVTAAQDTELIGFIEAAEAVIARHVGPLQVESVTRRVHGWGESLALPVLPAVSLTSVTPVGSSAMLLSDLYLDTYSGVVSLVYGGKFSSRSYDVVYQAGRASVPADILMAVKELVRHMWSTQRGGSKRPGSSASDAAANTLPGAGYLLPFRVSELLAPHVSPGFA